MKRFPAVIAALAGALALSSAASAQEDCPRGTLDKAYCDRNGDLTADPPTDPKKLLNPSPIRRPRTLPSIKRPGTAS